MGQLTETTAELQAKLDQITSGYLYTTDSVTGYKTRIGFVATLWVVDKELTATGFAGTENTDWENVTSG